MNICSFRSRSLKEGKKKWIRNIYLYVLKKGKQNEWEPQKRKKLIRQRPWSPMETNIIGTASSSYVNLSPLL